MNLRKASISQRVDYYLIRIVLILSYLCVGVSFLFAVIDIGFRSEDLTYMILFGPLFQGLVLIFTGLWQLCSSVINWFWAEGEWKRSFGNNALLGLGLTCAFVAGITLSIYLDFDRTIIIPLMFGAFVGINVLSWRYQRMLKRYYGI